MYSYKNVGALFSRLSISDFILFSKLGRFVSKESTFETLVLAQRSVTGSFEKRRRDQTCFLTNCYAAHEFKNLGYDDEDFEQTGFGIHP